MYVGAPTCCGPESNAFPVGLEDFCWGVFDVLEPSVSAEVFQSARFVTLDHEEFVEAVLPTAFHRTTDLIFTQAAVTLHTDVLLVDTPKGTQSNYAKIISQ